MKELFPKHADDVTQSTAYRVYEILSNDPPMLQVADTVLNWWMMFRGKK